MINRRKFFNVVAGVAAVVAVPAIAWRLLRRTPRPEIGTTFYSQVWVGEEGLQEAAFEQGSAAMKRVEKDREVRLGDYVFHHEFDKERAAWSVTTQASVVGHA